MATEIRVRVENDGKPVVTYAFGDNTPEEVIRDIHEAITKLAGPDARVAPCHIDVRPASITDFIRITRKKETPPKD